MPHESILIVYDDGREKRRAVRYNAVAVKLPNYDHPLHMVVVKGFGIKPMMLCSESACACTQTGGIDDFQLLFEFG